MRVEIEGLEFAYPPRAGVGGASSRPRQRPIPTQVLSGLNLIVASGSFQGIVGPSGCGKTSLLRLIAGLETPAAGTIRMVGESHQRFPAAMVFESPRLLPWWTVERNVGIGVEYAGRSKAIIDRVRDFYTSHVGLGGLGRRLPTQLSMGQQSRVGLARALAHEADVLLMDEPFAHLDAVSRRKMHLDMEELWMADGRTSILVTHDVNEAVMLSDRVSVLRSGAGPLVETVEVDVPRPRMGISLDHPGIRSAVSRVWDALERAAH